MCPFRVLGDSTLVFLSSYIVAYVYNVVRGLTAYNKLVSISK